MVDSIMSMFNIQENEAIKLLEADKFNFDRAVDRLTKGRLKEKEKEDKKAKEKEEKEAKRKEKERQDQLQKEKEQEMELKKPKA